tara:strand:- start:235 stop:651 length:417 start_codon:yes stop_codon:yes gene_type:complete
MLLASIAGHLLFLVEVRRIVKQWGRLCVLCIRPIVTEDTLSYKRISIDEAKALIDAGGATVGDVRAADAYLEGSIENAIHIRQEILDDFLANTDRDKPLIIYCYHGNSSQGAANYFWEQGFEEVYSVDGGYEAWRLKY